MLPMKPKTVMESKGLLSLKASINKIKKISSKIMMQKSIQEFEKLKISALKHKKFIDENIRDKSLINFKEMSEKGKRKYLYFKNIYCQKKDVTDLIKIYKRNNFVRNLPEFLKIPRDVFLEIEKRVIKKYENIYQEELKKISIHENIIKKHDILQYFTIVITFINDVTIKELELLYNNNESYRKQIIIYNNIFNTFNKHQLYFKYELQTINIKETVYIYFLLPTLVLFSFNFEAKKHCKYTSLNEDKNLLFMINLFKEKRFNCIILFNYNNKYLNLLEYFIKIIFRKYFLYIYMDAYIPYSKYYAKIIRNLFLYKNKNWFVTINFYDKSEEIYINNFIRDKNSNSFKTENITIQPVFNNYNKCEKKIKYNIFNRLKVLFIKIIVS